MADFIAKPIDPQQMLAVLAKHFGRRPTGSPAEPAATGSGESDADDNILSALSHVEGLDTAVALDRAMGRPDLYAKLARRIASERSDLPERLEAASAAGDAEQLRDLLHGAKTLLGALGATRLQHACAELERRLDAGESEDAAAGLAGELARLMDDVRAATRA
jgi:HPt (histidine-containing phosphotransfer) domain-containing protein